MQPEESSKLKKRAYSGPDSPPQPLGIENIAPDNVVRLSWVKIGLKSRGLLGLSSL